ncbi:hypothetical protein GOBAR_AA27952 [Gossypium barbadense]|uniref:Uncharacterized protein n=1 Tax=Gossypium barbadense TaxID=3634 RepID=A0A2P5WNQ0_GOSBA|nr:hypothetical protein GOBAR_AA27952 [Gossypium barbadense]
MYPLLAVDPGNDNIKTMVDGESRDAEDSTEKVLKTMYELWMLVERRSQRGKSDLRGYRGKDIEMEKLGLRVAALNGEGEVIGDESGIGEKFTDKDLDTGLEAQMGSSKDDVLHAGERSKLGHDDVGLRLKNLGKRNTHFKSITPLDLGVAGSPSNGLVGKSAIPDTNSRFKRGRFEPPMQASKFDGVKVHFNPAFKDPKEVDVQLTESILDPRKHSAVIFKENPNPNSHEHVEE